MRKLQEARKRTLQKEQREQSLELVPGQKSLYLISQSGKSPNSWGTGYSTQKGLTSLVGKN